MKYRWDDDRGVVDAEKDRQILQLVSLSGQNSLFRRYCGKLLVEALNREEDRKEKK